MELQRVAQGNEVKNKPTTLKHVPYNPPVTRALSKSGAMDSSAADPKLMSAHSSAGHDEAETSLSLKRPNRFERKPRREDEQRHKRRIARSDARSEAIEAALVAREADEAAETERRERRKEASQKKAEYAKNNNYQKIKNKQIKNYTGLRS